MQLLDSHRTQEVPAKPTWIFYHIAQRKQLLTVFSVFHQSCTWKDLSLYLRMFSNWLPSTVSAGELHSLLPWQSFCLPLWSALPQSPVPAQTPLFPLLPFRLPGQKVFQMIVSTVGPDHPTSTAVPAAGSIVHRTSSTKSRGTEPGLGGQGGRKALS